MFFDNSPIKFFKNENYFHSGLFILCTMSYFFFWDIKINIIKNFTVSFREIFYLLFVYLLFNIRKLDKKLLIKLSIFFIVFLIYNFLSFGVSFENLSIKHNIIALFFVFGIILICCFYQKDIISSLNLAFLIFIYIYAFSFIFSDIAFFSPNEKIRYCGLLNFRVINQNIFLEPSHMGMVLLPFYYYIFQVNKINFYQKLFLLIFIALIFVLHYSVTLLFSIIVCFFLMILIDYRFFLKNKLFFLCQLLIITTPIFQSNCLYKVNNTIENFSFLKSKTELSDKFIEVNILEKLEVNYNDDLFNIDEKLRAIDIAIKKMEKKELAFTRLDPDPEPGTENFTVLKTYKKELRKLIELKKKLTKTKLSQQLPYLSAAEMNFLIIQNAQDLPVLNRSKINDHSSAVLLNALNIAYLSIKDKPLGQGFNNYQTAFNKYMLENINPPFYEIYYLNFNDGSNNFVKLIVEFGIFSLLIFLNLIIFTLNKNISTSKRILLAGIIATQMVRAAGYFNGGFLLCLVLTFVLNYQSLINKK